MIQRHPGSLNLPLCLLLAAPAFVFALGWLAPGLGAACCVLLAAALGLASRQAAPGRPVDRPFLGLCLGLGLGVTVLSGTGHFFFQTFDWTIRDAVLVDLVGRDWPVGYLHKEEPHLLRAPLGMYLLPAAAGKLAGLRVAEFTLLAQNALLTALCLYGLGRHGASRREQGAIVAGALLFAGLDVVAMLGGVLTGETRLLHPDGALRLEYSGQMTLLLWTPHHALPGFAVAAAWLGWRRGEDDCSAPALISALGLLWSPLATMGSLLLVAYAMVWARAERTLRARQLAAPALAAIALLPVAFYLSRDTGELAIGLRSDPPFLFLYPGLILVDVAPAMLFLWQTRDRTDRRALWDYWLCLLPMLLFHFFTIGHDFARRAIIPIATLVAVGFAQRLQRQWDKGLGRDTRWILPVALLCLMNPLIEIGRNLVERAEPLQTCNLLEAWQNGPLQAETLALYLAQESAFSAYPWLFRARTQQLATLTPRSCWRKGRLIYFDMPWREPVAP